MNLFYNALLSENDAEVTFDKEESRHITKVLRKSEGDVLHITNGIGWLFEAEIIHSNIKKVTAEISSKTFKDKPSNNIHLAVAPTKTNERYEWFLEKATEIGVTHITPIFCEHSERKVIKPERYEKILQSAMKQSLNLYLPKLNPSTSFNDFISSPFKEQKFIAHCEETKRQDLKSSLSKNSDCIILIGPEGDFSVKEIKTALQHGYIPVTLGNTRLRTETAAIVACHTFALTNA